jgi:uncharacterized protein (DUF302 family)
VADAKQFVVLSAKAKFEEVRDELKLAIEQRGLVIDHESHIGTMLERTGKDLGSARRIYLGAQAFSFCSAVLSRKTMEADPANIAFCPYVLVVYETLQKPGIVNVSYRRSLPEVEKLLGGIAREALGLR